MRSAVRLALGGMMLFLANVSVTSTVAQEQFPICRASGLNFTPASIPRQLAQQGEWDGEDGGPVETKEEKRAREERERLEACERAKVPDDTPFSFYGYQHALAHCNNWVKQLQDSAGGSCCSNIYGGECRITEYDPVTRRVKIDGVMCPLTKGTRRGVVDVSPGLVLACAPRLTKDWAGKWLCPNAIHCIGRGPGL